jgi:hypothetical protein
MPTRIDAELYDAARSMGSAMSRSAAQQINHWARIGREFEASAGISHRDIARALAGQTSYDDLSAREQAVVRTSWEEQIADSRAGLDLAAEFEAAGISDFVGADADGETVIGRPESATRKSAQRSVKKRATKRAAAAKR